MGLPILTTGGGTCFAFPDVCKTPTPAGPVPIPYPNIAFCRDGKGSRKTRIRGASILRKGDGIRISTGDETGSAGNLISQKTKGKAELRSGCSRIRIEGKSPALHTARTGQNGGSVKPVNGLNPDPKQLQVTANQEMDLSPGSPLDNLLQECCPRLHRQVQDLRAEQPSWKFEYKAMKRKTLAGNCNKEHRKISVNSSLARFPGRVMQTLGHEVGHAKSLLRAQHYSDRNEYITKNTQVAIDDETRAFVNEGMTMGEVEENCPERYVEMILSRDRLERQEVAAKKDKSIGERCDDLKPQATARYEEHYRKRFTSFVEKNPGRFPS